MDIRKIIIEVLSSVMGEDYPSSFDMDTFKSLPTFKKRLEYAATHLKRLTSGSSRVVFEIDDKKVLKIAKNAKGLEQNRTESDAYIQDNFSDIVTKLYDTHPDDQWIEMEKAKRVGPNAFKNITGIDFKHFSDFLIDKGMHGTFKVSDEALKAGENNQFAQEVSNLMFEFDMPHGDFLRLNSYGVVNRDGKDMVVLVDFGLTRTTYNTYYKKVPSTRY